MIAFPNKQGLSMVHPELMARCHQQQEGHPQPIYKTAFHVPLWSSFGTWQTLFNLVQSNLALQIYLFLRKANKACGDAMGTM